jgi:predicted enzyme related to lactoylglutathione lyase
LPVLLQGPRQTEEEMPPTIGNGKICYLEIPATNIEQSSSFYEKVFGWKTRRRGDGHLAFDDGVGEVSGSWVLGRKPSTDVGLLMYVMVDSVEETLKAIVANGGRIVQPIGGDAPEITARFSDPTGNVLGLYQEPQSNNH